MNATPRSRGRLALRLYAIGVAQLVLLVLAALAVERITHGGPPPHERIGAALDSSEEQLVPVLDDEAARLRVLTTIHERYDVELSLYDTAGDVIASTVDPPVPLPRGPRFGPPRDFPPPPFPPPDFPPLLGDPPRGPHGHGFGLSRDLLRDGRTYTIALELARPLPRYVGGIATLLVGLVILGIGALFTARSLVGPLEKLARTAKRLGAGDLRARTEITREDELGDVARAIDSMAGDVEGLLRAERELLANVSHELRTPLARIRVAMDLAAEGNAERARAAVREIATDLGELEGLVDDILVALRFESGARAATAGLPLSSLEQVEAEDIAARSFERFRARHPERTFEVSVASDLPPVLVDRVLFRRVVDNVLENAEKYSPDRATPIRVTVSADDENVRFRVEDHGVGIAAEDLAHVFEPFYRGERSRSREAGGVGLGLTLAKRIAEAHGGAITIESTAGAGTTVTIAVPAWRG